MLNLDRLNSALLSWREKLRSVYHKDGLTFFHLVRGRSLVLHKLFRLKRNLGMVGVPQVPRAMEGYGSKRSDHIVDWKCM